MKSEYPIFNIQSSIFKFWTLGLALLLGGAVSAQEALAMGLVNRVTPVGGALAAAQELARQIAAFPQQCMLIDRASAYAQWSLPLEEALRAEGVRGAPVVLAEGVAGAARFAAGAGRHGKPD